MSYSNVLRGVVSSHQTLPCHTSTQTSSPSYKSINTYASLLIFISFWNFYLVLPSWTRLCYNIYTSLYFLLPFALHQSASSHSNYYSLLSPVFYSRTLRQISSTRLATFPPTRRMNWQCRIPPLVPPNLLQENSTSSKTSLPTDPPSPSHQCIYCII